MKTELRINAYEVVSRAVSEGIATGWRHAHKHTDTPGEDAIKAQIEIDVMDTLCEVVDFDED